MKVSFRQVLEALGFLTALAILCALPIIVSFLLVAFMLGAIYGARRCRSLLDTQILSQEVRANAVLLGNEAELDKGWQHYIELLETDARTARAANAVLRAKHDELARALRQEIGDTKGPTH
jgi:hypothetical protein